MTSPALRLPVHLQPKLQLPRVIGCGRLPGIGKKLVDVRDVVLICNIEDVHRSIQIYALTEIDFSANAQIIEHIPGFHSGIAAQVSVKCGQGWRASCGEDREARFLEESCGRILGRDRSAATDVWGARRHDVRPARIGRELEVVRVAGTG